MWRGEEDFTVLCSLYEFKIKIITLDGEREPSVTYIEPNPVLVRFSDFPDGKVPDMVVLHQKDVHYDLIVPDDSVLAIEGGLDYRRVEKKNQEKVEEGDMKCIERKRSISPKNVEIDPVGNPSSTLIKDLEEKITKFETEMKFL